MSRKTIGLFHTAATTAAACSFICLHEVTRKQNKDDNKDVYSIPLVRWRNTNTAVCENVADVHDEELRFRESLSHHRKLTEEYKRKWDYVSNVKSRIPTDSWPSYPESLPFPPDVVPLSSVMPELACCDRSPNYRNNDTYCGRVRFHVAHALLTQAVSEREARRALSLVKQLAELGQNPDAMCLYASTLNEGYVFMNLEADPSAAVSWWHHCHTLHPRHAPTIYELGVAYYTGEGVAEDETKAYRYFCEAADLGHAGAAFMLGDCLLDGTGCQRDRAEALRWLIRAGEWGHRGARSRVLAVLEYENNADYGGFTDSSRQTLVSKESFINIDEDDDDQQDDVDKEAIMKNRIGIRPNVILNERKYTLGGSNPQILKQRRKTIVESRKEK